ncbi:MAG: sulfite exporter TauE/SafE family protein [Cyclobacteriaceae bacterium]|nr:sulfite exporter TauE/SafE family protein [Cyclobacteriaceae bacterium]
MVTLFSFQLSPSDVIIILIVALLTGMSKTGVHGAGMLSVPLLAVVFGGQLSSGVLLPMLVLADVFGVWYYHRHASWQHLKILFPWAAVGVVAGTVTGSYINDQVFKWIMAATIIVSVGIMLWLERLGEPEHIPKQKSFAIATGIAGGFTSMVGNLAGSVMSVYLLSIRLPKNAFIGTTAWFFLVVNWFKVPFHVVAWHTITWKTVGLDLLTLPFILLGAWLGIVIVRKLTDRMYRWFIIIMTLIAAIGMLL